MERLKRLIHPLGVAAAAFLVQLPVFDRTMSLMDEGHILQFADILSRGGELYRDAALLPLPGAFYLLSAAFDWFGPSIRVARWLVVAEFTLLATVVFLLMHRMLPARWAWRGVGLLIVYRFWAFPHWTMFSYSTTALTLLALGLLLFVRFLDRGGRWGLAAAGFVTGLGVLCKQDYGMAVLLGMNAVLFVAARARATLPAAPLPLFAWLNAPAAAVGAVTAFHYLRQGLFGEMLQQTLLNHLLGIASFDYTGLPPLLPLFEPQAMLRTPFGIGAYAPSILFTADWELWRQSRFYQGLGWDLLIKGFFYAPYVIVAGAALRMVWTRSALADPERRGPWLQELALSVFAASLVLALNRPVDYVHVAVLYWPLLLLLLLWLHLLLRDRPRATLVAGIVVFLVSTVVVVYTGRLAWSLRTVYDTPLRGERAGVYVKPGEEKVIGGVVDYVRTHSQPGQRVAVLPYFPLISFLAERDAPHRAMYTFWPVAYIPDREQQIADAIEASGTDFVVYHFTQWAQFPKMDAYAPELFAWLVRHYEMETIFSEATWGYKLAVLRRAPEPQGIPLVAPDAVNARVYVERSGQTRLLPRERRAELVRTALWPFRPVVALRPLSGERRSMLSVPVDVPASGGMLETAVGVHPEHWFRFPPADVRFELAVRGHDGEQTLFERTLDPHRHPEQRGWVDVQVPLDAYAGQRVDLILRAATSSPLGEVFHMGGWELPRLLPGALD